MGPSKPKIITGIASLVSILPITSLVFFLYSSLNGGDFNVFIFSALTAAIDLLLTAVFGCLGAKTGITALVVLVISFHYRLNGYTSDMLSLVYLSFIFSGLIGNRIREDFNKLSQREKIDTEKIEERMNVLQDESNQHAQEITHLEKRLDRYLNLNRITELFSSTFSLNDIASIIVESVHELFPRSDRALLFIVDTDSHELKLIHSKRIGDVPAIRLKKGDIYDRWVFWKKQPLIVEDIKKDFRFSPDDIKTERPFNSLISCPITSGEKVLGIIRVDSKAVYAYTGDDIRLLDIISDLASVAVENCLLYRRLSDMAITDGLTSLYVNKFFKEMLANEVNRAHKTNSVFSLIIFDIDNFKNYNDRYGHIAGDLVLKHISSILSKSLSGGEAAARYGGEEFAVLLPAKDKTEALKFAEELRKNIENTPIILRREKTHVTISIGIASFPNDSKVAEDILRYADKRLYTAKEKGKNRTCVL